MKKKRNRIKNDATRVANLYQGEGYINPDEWEMLRDEIANSTGALYTDLAHQLKLQIKYQQGLRRSTVKRSPHRTDMIREQDVAIWALKDLLKRFEEKVL